MRSLLFAGALLLSACNRTEDDSIGAVPEPTAENASNLMAEAERAAANAQARSERLGVDMQANQGEAK